MSERLFEGFATAQISVGAAATLIASAKTGRDEVTIQNLGTTPVYIGNSDVSPANGFPLPGVAGASITLPVTTAIYGIVASGSANIAVLSTQ